MPFRISETEDDALTEWIAGEWSFPTRPRFIRSRSLDVLKRELSRYIRQEVNGRSFLVAGHRGTGKTSLVHRAVDDLNRKIAGDAFEALGRSPSIRLTHRQRPLLVKLHGPSLLAPPIPARATDLKDGEEATGGSTGTGTRAANFTNPGDQAKVETLAQIVIALYRALTTEYGRCVLCRARTDIREQRVGADRAAEHMELAGQFLLDLDNIPKPAVLRAYYHRLGGLESGVLWPTKVAATFPQGGLNDQGVREMTALVTAAQAFAVCAGKWKTDETNTDTRSQERSVEWKGEASFKDLTNKLFGIFAGLAVGIGSAPSLNTGSVVAGLAAGLLTVLTLGWSSKRSVRTERVVTHTFILDRSRQDLERDLPLVIQRVRDAGLAPVFVVDELDKVPDAEIGSSIANLMGHLKHLTTDFGAFCFLTDRSYYEAVLGRSETQAFPPEHTYFSHRLFITYQPKELRTYLENSFQPISATPLPGSEHPARPTSDVVARRILVLHLLQRSRLNTIDLFRELANLVDEKGDVRKDEAALRTHPAYRLSASVQLAISSILEGESLRQRMEDEPRFAQVAADVMYMLSRAWEAEKVSVDLSRPAIVRSLRERAGHAKIEDSAQEEEALLSTAMGKVDLDLLVKGAESLAGLLSDFAALKVALTPPSPAEIPAEVDVLLAGGTGLVKKIGNGSFQFLYDAFGRPIETESALSQAAGRLPPLDADPSSPDVVTQGTGALTAEQGPEAKPGSSASSGKLPETVAMAIDRAVSCYEAFKAVLSGIGVSLADLRDTRAFPSTALIDSIDAAADRLQQARGTGSIYDSLSSELLSVQEVGSYLRGSGRSLDALLRLALYVRRDAGDKQSAEGQPRPLAPALAAVSRYLDLPRAFGSAHQGTTTGADPLWTLRGSGFPEWPEAGAEVATFLQGGLDDPDVLLRWGEDLQGLASTLGSRDFDYQLQTAAWKEWTLRLEAYLPTRVDSALGPSYLAMVTAAAGRSPGRLFRRHLRLMTLEDWSVACLSGFPGSAVADTPHWMFVAGLWVLGFDRRVLARAWKEVARLGDGLESASSAGSLAPPRDMIEQLIVKAPAHSPPGVVIVLADEGSRFAGQIAEDFVPIRTSPVIVLSMTNQQTYIDAVAWLRKLGAVGESIYERD